MRVCLMIEGQEGVTWDQWRALATTAEAAGFDALFRSDHYMPLQGGPSGSLDAWATLSALAALTARWADEYNTIFATPHECRERRERVAAACAEIGRDPLPFSLMTTMEGTSAEIVARTREYEEAGVERIMIQHLRHEDLETVERIGREVIREVA